MDNVSAHAVKLVTDIVSQVLAHIVNTIFVSAVFPALMNIAKVVSLYKSADKKRIENYCPILVLPIFSIIPEKNIRFPD